ncbi:DUF6230 family protein [Marinactinospora thermotolerans]|uniref:Cholesterol esterase n=1 Tax=Marinactinospora thermotolerans DSM 45154 TaxID=1122192 RepID=A0A1T4RTZ5_9ACTN|nr:DUF6230 family protein [Marinactinospora thermotolerans]SKA19367.1 hypothetical protein SAMN02745673_02978 [Marinactinospora thermotolerans DSM 45154]
MAEETQTIVQGGVGWRRFLLALGPALGAAAVLVVLTAQGSIAASFAVSGQNFKVSADSLEGTGFAQFGDVATSVDDTAHPVALSVIDDAELTNLCQSVLMETPVGDVTLLVEAGQDGTPVTARNMVIDLEQLSGEASFSGMQIGRDASTLENASGEAGAPGGFGMQAGTINVTDLRLTAWSVNAGTFGLNGLQLGVKPGDHECF